MKIQEQTKGKNTILTLEGRLDSNTSTDVEKKIFDALNAGTKNVIIDFSGLEYISSSGIRILIRCHKELEKISGHLYLCAVPKPIENILYITGFLPYFKVFERQAQALSALEKED
jgi:anti-sigma B factor antagonist